MKLITMKFTVVVDDEPTYMSTGEKLTLEEATKDLYDHICMWECNEHGSVEVEEERITDIS
jgi:hypothetical protein